MKRPDKVFACIVWDDAHKTLDEVAEDDLNHHPSRCHTYGWLIRSDEFGISIASEWGPNDGYWRNKTFIPRPMVVEEIHLSLSNKRKKVVRDRTVPAAPSG